MKYLLDSKVVDKPCIVFIIHKNGKYLILRFSLLKIKRMKARNKGNMEVSDISK